MKKIIILFILLNSQNIFSQCFSLSQKNLKINKTQNLFCQNLNSFELIEGQCLIKTNTGELVKGIPQFHCHTKNLVKIILSEGKCLLQLKNSSEKESHLSVLRMSNCNSNLTPFWDREIHWEGRRRCILKDGQGVVVDKNANILKCGGIKKYEIF